MDSDERLKSRDNACLFMLHRFHRRFNYCHSPLRLFHVQLPDPEHIDVHLTCLGQRWERKVPVITAHGQN